MKAIKSNLVPDSIMLCTECGAEYSTDSGDYWDLPNDHKFECCGMVMIIGHWERTFIES